MLFDGEDIWKDVKLTRQIRFKVGLVFQYPEYQLFEETVYQDIAFGPKNMGLSEEEIRARVAGGAALSALRTPSWKNRRLTCPAGRSAERPLRA